MRSNESKHNHLSLLELNGKIKNAITGTLTDMYWVVAEIAEIKLNQKGHCYIELVEKKDSSTVAKIQATIWAYEYGSISRRFKEKTGETLKQGMNILFLASVSFHEVYGLSLNIRDVDPAYTIGDMARKKKEIIMRLVKEGLIDRNRLLEFPLVPQRIGIISSPTAAGYGDFIDQLTTNPYGYKFKYALSPAIMQGPDAERSIISSLEKLFKREKDLDVIVIIRGGGSVTDLSCFDSYPIGACIAKSPLPVLTGIGHEKDDTIADLVAHTRLKTPTAVAEFIISAARGFEESVLDIQTRIVSGAEKVLKYRMHTLELLIHKLSLTPLKLTSVQSGKLNMIYKDLCSTVYRCLQKNEARLSMLQQAVKHLDPANILRRGYSITRYMGKAIKKASVVPEGAVIETEFHEGKIKSVIKRRKENIESGKKQGDDLLPGFE